MAFSANNEEEMIEALKARHFPLLSTMSLRLANVKHLRSFLSNAGDKKSFLGVLGAIPLLEDQSVLVDVLKAVGGKPGLWTLEMFREVLPQLSNVFSTSIFEE